MVQTSTSSAGIPRGIPGKLFVVPFIVLLIVLCILMIAVAVRFQTIMAQLERSRSLWPIASQELVPRYEAIDDSFIGKFAGEARNVDWRQCKRDFQDSNQFDRQAAASLVLENQISRLLQEKPNGLELVELSLQSIGLSELIEAERRRQSLQSDFIGWLTVQSLRLKLPIIYDPQRIYK